VKTDEEFEQKYETGGDEPVQVWVYCRLCRCRVQIRTKPTPELPFRCYCGQQGTLGTFDVFSEEDEARRFASTFEDIYQATKELLHGANMPMVTTGQYSPEQMRALKEGRDPVIDSAEEEAPPLMRTEDAEAGFKQTTRVLTDAVVRAHDILEKHEALTQLGVYVFVRRSQFADARRLCYQACETDVHMATDVVKEAARRHRLGQPVRLKFSLFKRLIMLYVEDRQLERALQVAIRGTQLGFPGYEERIQMLRAQLAKQGGPRP
jgi:hypothetical protein